MSNFSTSTALSHCINPLLEALGWSGTQRDVFEAKPHLAKELDLNGFMNTMANLHFTTRSARSKLLSVHQNLLPCLFIQKDGTPFVLLSQLSDSYLVYNGEEQNYTELKINEAKGEFFFFTHKEENTYNPHNPQRNWFLRTLLRFRSLITITLVLSFILSITAVATPLVIMGIYDFILTADSLKSLNLLWIGIVSYLLAEVGFMLLRYKLLNYSSARIGNMVNNQVFRRILYMPPAFTGNSTVGTQISRINDFTSVQGFIGGHGIVSILDLPFVIVLIVTMALFSGNLVIVPIATIVAMSTFTLLSVPLIRRISEMSSETSTQKHEFTIELFSKFREIRLAGAVPIWNERYRRLSAEAIMGGYYTSLINNVINNVGQGIVTISGTITIGWGVIKVIDGSMSAGGLMAAMMIVWRILAPVKTAFSIFSQSVRIKKSTQQLNRLMSLDVEKNIHSAKELSKSLTGDIQFQNISIRYSQEAAPALLGFEINIKSGELLGITGHDGSGKSTIIKLILAMYKPQSGRILLDQFNIQQLNPIQVRRSIGYSPASHDFFYGTIAQNLRLVNPMLTDEEMESLATQVNMLDDIKALPKGFDSRIGDQSSKTLPMALSRKISIARALINDCPILLLDEPERGLESNDIDHLVNMLLTLKNQKTILLVTQNEKLQAIVNRLVIMEEGKILDIKTPSPESLEV